VVIRKEFAKEEMASYSASYSPVSSNCLKKTTGNPLIFPVVPVVDIYEAAGEGRVRVPVGISDRNFIIDLASGDPCASRGTK